MGGCFQVRCPEDVSMQSSSTQRQNKRRNRCRFAWLQMIGLAVREKNEAGDTIMAFAQRYRFRAAW